MPSKYRNKMEALKEQYAKVAAEKKDNAKMLYKEHKEIVLNRTAARKLTDKTGKKKNAAKVRKKLLEDVAKCENKRIRSRLNTSKRLQIDTAYREENRARASVRTKQRLLENEAYREENRVRARVSKKQRLLENKAYREENRARARVTTKQRLLENKVYREENRARARVTTKQRLLENKVYREENRARARVRTKQRLLANEAYREQNRARARLSEQRRWSEDMSYRKQCIERAKASRKSQLEQYKQHTQQVLNHYTTQQLYWIKRKRVLSVARRQQRKVNQQKKMQAQSSVFLLDIKLLFTRSEKAVATGLRKIQALHKILSDKVVMCLDNMSDNSNPNEIEIAAAFGEVRIHTAASEPYFW